MISYPEDFNPVLRKWRKGFILHPQRLIKQHQRGKDTQPSWEVKQVSAYPADADADGNTKPAPNSPRHVKSNNFKEASKRLWKTYCRYSTIHGIRFATDDDISLVLRISWACALIGAAIIACWVCQHFFNKARKFPITTRVAQDHLELHHIVFPAIAFCPTKRVRFSVARDYIRRELEKSHSPAAAAFLNMSKDIYDRQILSFVTAMSHFELQSLRAAELPFTKSQRLLTALADMNITDFMLTTLPKCEELISKCEWHNVPMNCCKEMMLQQSPIGYCYAFNSLSVMARKHCTTHTEVMTVEQTAKGLFSEDTPECRLRRTTGFGVGSGLRVQIKELPKEYDAEGVEEMLMVMPRSRATRVGIYSPVRYPKAGSFARIRPNWNQHLLIAVSLDSTTMSNDVGSMDYSLTECLGTEVPESLKPRTLDFYTYSTCKLECRIKYMRAQCGCFPYFFGGEQQCKTKDLLRCTRLCKQIHWQLPPNDPKIKKKFGILDQIGTNCTKCVPRCQTSSYYPDVSIQYTNMPIGVIDIFYRDLTAAKLYRIDKTYADVDIATYLGSIAGLCLGCSILTLVEITFYLTKLIYLACLQYGGVFNAVRRPTNKTKFPKRIPFKRKIQKC